MHSAGEVVADPLHVPTRPPEDHSTVVSRTYSGAVKEGVLGVVFHAVADDEVEVVLKLIQVLVFLGVDAFPHGGEIHWMFDVIQIVGNLHAQKSNW